MKILVITDRPMTPVAHQTMEAIFKAFGVSWKNLAVFSTMSETDVKKVKPEQWLAQTEAVHKVARGYDKVLCSGSVAAACFFELDKGITVSKVRGRGYLHQLHSTKINKFSIITYPTSTMIKDPEFYRDICFDTCKLIENDGPIKQPECEIHLVERVKDLSLLRDLHEASFLGCDIETTGLGLYKGMLPHIEADILGIGFCALTEGDEGYAVVVPQDLIRHEVYKFLQTYKGTFVFHNLKFDTQHLYKKFGRFEYVSLADTMLLGWALDERPFNRYRHLGLELLQRLYFDTPQKSVRMGEWLEEYYRKDVGDAVRQRYIAGFCESHPEKARTLWRQATNPADAEWRGRKVGRDIDISVVAPHVPLPRDLQPAPDHARKEVMWDDMMRYMGEDCHSTARLYPILQQEAEDESSRLLSLHRQFLIPASLALGNMEMTGARVDLPYLKEMLKTLEHVLEGEMIEIRKLVKRYTNWGDINAEKNGDGFNPNSSLQVKQVLYNAGDEGGLGLAMPRDVGRYAYKREEGEITTNADTLKVLARQCAKDMPAAAKLINLILSYRVKSKIVGTYIQGILDRVDKDGRVRSDFNLHGTATGRLSSSNPNLQNIPDVSHVGYDIRKAYIPSRGWVCLEADYSQLELRVAGLFSQDEVLIEAYRNGADIHQEVAELLFNKEKKDITKYERYLAKCMNFGVIYGRGWKSIATGPEMDNLVEQYGKSWGENEIAAYFSKFQDGYADLFAWMEVLKDYAFKRKYVEGPLGNRRRWPLAMAKDSAGIKRQIVNSPIQGFAAQLTLNALIHMDREFDPRKQRLLFTVHDSILIECKNRDSIIQQTGDLVREIMEERLPTWARCPFPTLDHAPFALGDPLIYNIPFVADVVYGESWGECKNEIETRAESGVLA
jgi:DNA polymerase I-like protein with 3'-5' exonuclease and polymerase domains